MFSMFLPWTCSLCFLSLTKQTNNSNVGRESSTIIKEHMILIVFIKDISKYSIDTSC